MGSQDKRKVTHFLNIKIKTEIVMHTIIIIIIRPAQNKIMIMMNNYKQLAT